MNQPNLVQFFLGFGILQGIVLAIALLLSKRHRRQSNVLLAIFLLAYSFKLLLNTNFAIGVGIGNYMLSILFLGPSLYLYAKSVTDRDFKLNLKHLFHLLPIVLYGIIIQWSVDRFGIRSHDQVFNDPYLLKFTSILQGGVAAQVLIYTAFFIAEIRSYRKWVKNNYSNLDKINLDWLNRLSYAFAFILLIWFLVGYADIAYFINLFGEPSLTTAYVFWISMSIVILAIGYYGILRPEIFLDPRKIVETEAPDRKLKTPEVETLKSNLERLMRKEKPYLDQTLRLSQLAEMSELNTSILSMVINEGTGKNFNDFVNEFRVNEFIERLNSEENQHLTLLAIAYDSGFNSKSTFNAMFKKFTGMTPNQYKNQQKEIAEKQSSLVPK